jgi:hypothetical protein
MTNKTQSDDKKVIVDESILVAHLATFESQQKLIKRYTVLVYSLIINILFFGGIILYLTYK